MWEGERDWRGRERGRSVAHYGMSGSAPRARRGVPVDRTGDGPSLTLGLPSGVSGGVGDGDVFVADSEVEEGSRRCEVKVGEGGGGVEEVEEVEGALGEGEVPGVEEGAGGDGGDGARDLPGAAGDLAVDGGAGDGGFCFGAAEEEVGGEVFGDVEGGDRGGGDVAEEPALGG